MVSEETLVKIESLEMLLNDSLISLQAFENAIDMLGVVRSTRARDRSNRASDGSDRAKDGSDRARNRSNRDRDRARGIELVTCFFS